MDINNTNYCKNRRFHHISAGYEPNFGGKYGYFLGK
jgi:hypothetical protein